MVTYRERRVRNEVIRLRNLLDLKQEEYALLKLKDKRNVEVKRK